MHYVGRRRSEHNPIRSVPLFRPAALVFGPSETDHLIGDLRELLSYVSGYAAAYDKARAALSKANRVRKEWRRASQRVAMVDLNIARGAMRTNARKIAKLQARLLAMAVPADRWADAAASAQRA